MTKGEKGRSPVYAEVGGVERWRCFFFGLIGRRRAEGGRVWKAVHTDHYQKKRGDQGGKGEERDFPGPVRGERIHRGKKGRWDTRRGKECSTERFKGLICSSVSRRRRSFYRPS